MSPQLRRGLAIVVGALTIIAVFRLVVSLALLLRGENPADYMADAPTSIAGVVVLGVGCWALRGEYAALLTRPRSSAR